MKPNYNKESQIKANLKYRNDKDKVSRVIINFYNEDYERYKMLADKMELSFSGFVKYCVEKQLSENEKI